MSPIEVSKIIKESAKSIGFDSCGISRAEALNTDANVLKKWLDDGMNGSMHYMENHFEKRIDPRELVPGAKSVISLSLNYFPKSQQKENTPKVARYAYGEDYHRVIKDKLKALVDVLQSHLGTIQGRVFTDSAPVLERAWARQSGIGWIGKNSLLIQPGKGSYFFLAEIISDIEAEPDSPIRDYCGTCTACIDACPTQAILPGKIVDSNACISYMTIEQKTPIADNAVEVLNDYVFGCDICQEVCPWNRFSKPLTEKRFEASDWVNWEIEMWKQFDEADYKKYFASTPIERATYNRFRKNCDLLLHAKK